MSLPAAPAPLTDDSSADLHTLASLSEHNPNPIVRLDATGRQLYANAAARTMGHGLSREEQVRIRRQLRAVARNGAPSQEIQVGERFFMLQVAASEPPTGCITLYLAETTDRVRAERQLAEQQAFMSAILDATPSLIFVRDETKQMVFENRATTELRRQLGYLHPTHVQPPTPRQAEEWKEYIATDAYVLATGEQLTVEVPTTLASGEVRYFCTIKRLLERPDGTRQVLVLSNDITEEKLATDTLAQQEKQYRDLMMHSHALICTHDLQGELLSVNPAAAELLGRPLSALPGCLLHELVAPEHRPAVTSYLQGFATTDSQRGTLAINDNKGRTRYLLYDNYLVREAGQSLYVIGYGQEITERVLAEQELLRAKTAAEAAVRARENFLANVSHEIRTPLNGVLGMASQLGKTLLDGRQQEFVRTIRHAGHHLLHVINDVLDMAKITSGKLEMESVAFNLCDSMGEALRPLIAQANEKGIHFAGTPLRTTCSYPWVLGDPHRLNQILINLVANALKFTDPGGRVMVIGEQLAATDKTITVRFSVEDTGIGIAPEKQQLIFEGFTQAYSDTTRRFGGTGLGLSISRALVEQLGGQLMLSSVLGQGSIFAFMLTLPKAPAPVIASPLVDAYDTGALQGRRLLVVEDNEINRTVARLLFEGWGAIVEEAKDGLAGVHRVRDEVLYDVVLMDIQLPGLNGLDATAAIRALPDPQRANIPIVALTANAFRADRDRYLAAGMNACLAKPFEDEEVYRTLAQLLPAPADAPAYDLAKLRVLARGREEFVLKIIRSFLRNMPESLAQLRQAATENRWSEVAKITHHIKPSLESVGMHQVAAAVEQLEAATPADYPHLPAAASHLATHIERVLAQLAHELPQEQGG
ncbi:PAS domain-containing hybrid sensor histidine kinase/response regulator [Hymenobacter sp. BRD67]|uniref:PAS domain-containing hybrid sensor histidine kinase/response regulator n=1 Tax=Hymenobacter sp. BRD67 TaxID=2675877 RepID=UPI0015637676|nr:ATP-binding protein [Hymenobacter sp. BRD67]QKG51801.1 response regulator [Hymenobacter sp. BRD67]